MTWEGFWLPNIIQATLFATLAALVGVLARRWIKQGAELMKPLLEQLFQGQQEIKNDAKTAAEQSTTAATSATAAVQHSRRAEVSAVRADESASTAGSNSLLANEAILAMNAVIADQAATIRDLTNGNDEMAERIDGLLGTRARQLAQERLATATGALLIPRTAAEPDDAATVTGRHSLHRPHPDDGDFQ